MPINESYHISSFRSRKFIDRFFDSCLILSFQIWEENWNSCLKELYVFARKYLCFGTGCKSFAKYFLSEFSVPKINPRHKNYISSYIWHGSFIQTVKCSFLDENLFIKVFMMCNSRLVIFLLQGKVLCFARVNKLLARCLFVESIRSTLSKKFISGCFWLKLFIQNGKMLYL